MICKSWKHKWRKVPFVPSGRICGKCGYEDPLTQAQRRAWSKRLEEIRDKFNGA